MKTIHKDIIVTVIVMIVCSVFLDARVREVFMEMTKAYPVQMGFWKFALLATFGENLAIRLSQKKWKWFENENLKRAAVWGFLGMVITYAFAMFSFGVDGIAKLGYLPVPASEGIFRDVAIAFYKSVFTNFLFGFQMMVFHRITDTLIDKKMLLTRWPFLEIWTNLNWDNLWRVVGLSLIWFWIPAHTITFSLPAEFRILMAAMLSIVLGVILAFAKLKANKVN